MANFLASRIINEKLTYQEVPESLKKDVAEILEDKGFSNLIIEILF